MSEKAGAASSRAGLKRRWRTSLKNAAQFGEDAGQIRISAWNEVDEIVFSDKDKRVRIPNKRLPAMYAQIRWRGGPLSHGGFQSPSRDRGHNRGREAGAWRREKVHQQASRVIKKPSGAAVTLLVVDDIVVTALDAGRLLGLIGREAAMAFDATDAIDVADELRQECLVLNIRNPCL